MVRHVGRRVFWLKDVSKMEGKCTEGATKPRDYCRVQVYLLHFHETAEPENIEM